MTSKTHWSHLSEEFDDLGRLQRTCSSEVSVNKCEGACTSQVQPSVITPTGFLKARPSKRQSQIIILVLFQHYYPLIRHSNFTYYLIPFSTFSIFLYSIEQFED